MSGVTAFRTAFLNADPQRAAPNSAAFDAFCTWPARQLRYDLFWALYQNNALWEQLHLWSPLLKTRFGLYKHTRHVFNPIYRLGEFWATHLVGGALDRKAGDGQEVKSALPIEAENEAIRAGIARLWRDSLWPIQKDVWGRTGAIMGDVGLKACDDPDRGGVCLQVVHPGHIKWVDRAVHGDGRVNAYILEEWRHDPRLPLNGQLNPTVDPNTLKGPVRYNEEAWTEKGRVQYRTYLDGAPFDWRIDPADGRPHGTKAGARSQWTAPYAFVPFVVTQHIPTLLTYGMAEPHALLTKVFEADDTGSNVGDYVRRLLNGPIAFTGVKNPKTDITVASADATEGNPQKSRAAQPWVCLPKDADVRQMLAELNVEAVGQHADRLCAEIEKDYPELRYYLMNSTGDASGRALRVARQATESKVQMRRAGYDAGLVLAQRMALAIGGMAGYEGYAGLGADSPDDPKLEHNIGHRPVFAPDPLDDIEEGTAFWGMVGAAVTAGMPLEVILEREGWPPEDIARVVQAKAEAQQAAMDQVQQRMDMAGGGGGGAATNGAYAGGDGWSLDEG